MGIYQSTLLPVFYDWSERLPELDAARQRAVEYANGHVLEVGTGPGSTLDFYPPEITSLTAIDPDPGMNARLRRRMRHLPFPVDCREGCAERLPAKDAAYDCVVSVFTLGLLANPEQALAEFRRVLKPGGRLLLAELTVDEESPAATTWQRRLALPRRFLSGGYRLVSDPEAALLAADLAPRGLARRRLERFPRLLGTLVEGMATREN